MESKFVILLLVIGVAVAELPSPFFSGYPAPAKQQQLPQYAPAKQFARIREDYGPPEDSYGPPAQQYGPPAQQQREAIVTKNVYVHIAPEEPVEYKPSKQVEIPTPRKHYKIIFIKAPNPPTPTAPVLPERIEDEHKTLVYVLVKKPEEAPEVEIPEPATTEPSKPEVYFIKYKEPEKELQREYGPPKQQYGPPKQQYGPPN